MRHVATITLVMYGILDSGPPHRLGAMNLDESLELTETVFMQTSGEFTISIPAYFLTFAMMHIDCNGLAKILHLVWSSAASKAANAGSMSH